MHLSCKYILYFLIVSKMGLRKEWLAQTWHMSLSLSMNHFSGAFAFDICISLSSSVAMVTIPMNRLRDCHFPVSVSLKLDLTLDAHARRCRTRPMMTSVGFDIACHMQNTWSKSVERACRFAPVCLFMVYYHDIEWAQRCAQWYAHTHTLERAHRVLNTSTCMMSHQSLHKSNKYWLSSWLVLSIFTLSFVELTHFYGFLFIFYSVSSSPLFFCFFFLLPQSLFDASAPYAVIVFDFPYVIYNFHYVILHHRIGFEWNNSNTNFYLPPTHSRRPT